MARKSRHEINGIALAYVRCSCGWEHRLDSIRGKSDEMLAMETHEEFMSHQREQEK